MLPIENSTNSRRANGQFAPGNPGGPGNPHARKVGQYRSAILDATTETDLIAVWSMVIKQAKAGESWAVREFLDRVVGKVASPDKDAAGEEIVCRIEYVNRMDDDD